MGVLMMEKKEDLLVGLPVGQFDLHVNVPLAQSCLPKPRPVRFHTTNPGMYPYLPQGRMGSVPYCHGSIDLPLASRLHGSVRLTASMAGSSRLVDCFLLFGSSSLRVYRCHALG